MTPARADLLDAMGAALCARLAAEIATEGPRRSLLAYARLHSPEYQAPWHIRLIAAKLEAVERGEIKRLMLALPPRHGKSELASRYLPAWYLGRDPKRTVIAASYGQELADDFGRRVRNLVASSEHLSVFPGSVLAGDSAAANRFSTKAGGTYFAVGSGAAITGRGGSLLVLDDLLKGRREADSETVRRQLKEWYAEVAYTRLAPGGAVVVIGTRWHQDDLGGWLLAEHASQGWEVVSFPALAEHDEPHRREGEALWPERYPREALLATRAQLGSAAFASLYQQRPSAAEGAIFRRQWWGGYSTPPESFSRIVMSLDTAFKGGAENDYSVCTTWGETATGYYLLHVWRERVEFPALLATVLLLADQWHPSVVLVEDKASGQSLVQVLRDQTRLPVHAVKVGTDKVSRANAITPTIEAGRVYLPSAAGWLDDYLDEVSQFPNGAHDDQVDSTTQAVEYMAGLTRRMAGSGWLEIARQAEEEAKRKEQAA